MTPEKRALWRKMNRWIAQNGLGGSHPKGPMTDEAVDACIASDEARHRKPLDQIYRPTKMVRCSHCGAPIPDYYSGKAYVGECCR
jgi:hypothetical protein